MIKIACKFAEDRVHFNTSRIRMAKMRAFRKKFLFHEQFGIRKK